MFGILLLAVQYWQLGPLINSCSCDAVKSRELIDLIPPTHSSLATTSKGVNCPSLAGHQTSFVELVYRLIVPEIFLRTAKATKSRLKHLATD